MATKRTGVAVRIRSPKAGKITYVTQAALSRLAKERSAFAVWRKKEELRLSGVRESRDFERMYKGYQQETERRRGELWRLENQALDEKQERLGRDWPHGTGKLTALQEAEWLPALRTRPKFWDEKELAPTRTFIYRGAPAVTSDLIYPCPDLRQWSGLFGDDEVTLNQGYRSWFPSTAPHPFLRDFYFTGGLTVSTGINLEGVVYIAEGGSVTVGVETFVDIVQCDAPDKNHDHGWHYDPDYDSRISTWRSLCDGCLQRIFVDTGVGLHPFAHYINHMVAISSSCGAPNRFIEVSHLVTITAVNASCQFGPNRADCATGPYHGWIATHWPHLALEYLGPPPWRAGTVV